MAKPVTTKKEVMGRLESIQSKINELSSRIAQKSAQMGVDSSGGPGFFDDPLGAAAAWFLGKVIDRFTGISNSKTQRLIKQLNEEVQGLAMSPALAKQHPEMKQTLDALKSNLSEMRETRGWRLSSRDKVTAWEKTISVAQQSLNSLRKASSASKADTPTRNSPVTRAGNGAGGLGAGTGAHARKENGCAGALRLPERTQARSQQPSSGQELGPTRPGRGR